MQSFIGDQPRFLVRFWGVRGSYPTPGSHTVRHGGNTTCLQVQAGSHTIILDAGSGIIRLGEELMHNASGQSLEITLLITHGHNDHLLGFPFFAPFFESTASIHCFGPSLDGRSIEQLVTPLMSPPYFPVDIHRLPSQRTFHTIADRQHIIWRYGEQSPVLSNELEYRNEAEVRVVVQFTRSHPLNGAVLYRIEYAGRRLVFATDVEWGDQIDPDFIDFAKEADLLIHDAQYTTEDYKHDRHGFGHSTVEMATRVAEAAQVHELILFHHDPTYDDNKLDSMETLARGRFAATRSAYEGLEIDLLTSRT